MSPIVKRWTSDDEAAFFSAQRSFRFHIAHFDHSRYLMTFSFYLWLPWQDDIAVSELSFSRHGSTCQRFSNGKMQGLHLTVQKVISFRIGWWHLPWRKGAKSLNDDAYWQVYLTYLANVLCWTWQENLVNGGICHGKGRTAETRAGR